jgi:phenylacetate-coenzyme A ligase PaaK-like adenylate-forming protein
VRLLIVAGEPGGSIPPTRERIERNWGARVIDHHGLTEVGPVSFECWEAPGYLHVNEGQFIAEVLDPASGRAVADGEHGELVVTNLGRTGQSGDPVPHRRHRRTAADAVSVRAHVGTARKAASSAAPTT